MCQGITDPILLFQALRITGGEQEGRQPPPPPPPKKGFLWMYPFFRRALEMPFLKEVTKNLLEN